MKILIALIISTTFTFASLSEALLTHSTPQIDDELTKQYTKNKIQKAKKYLGTRYIYGASTRTTKRFDCSSFVKHVYKDKKLPRTSREQFKVGIKRSKNTCKTGDLIFFADNKRYIGHVGIIIDPKKKLMIHASSARGKVVISSYNTKYYNRKYRGIRDLS